MAKSGVNHDNKKTITAKDSKISNNRFKNLLIGTCNGMSRKEMIGIYS